MSKEIKESDYAKQCELLVKAIRDYTTDVTNAISRMRWKASELSEEQRDQEQKKTRELALLIEKQLSLSDDMAVILDLDRDAIAVDEVNSLRNAIEYDVENVDLKEVIIRAARVMRSDFLLCDLPRARKGILNLVECKKELDNVDLFIKAFDMNNVRPLDKKTIRELIDCAYLNGCQEDRVNEFLDKCELKSSWR